MNKAQLVKAVAKSAQATKTDAESVLNAAIASIREAVEKGEDVTLIGFGTFTLSRRRQRAGRDPRTGEAIQIPAMVLPKFRAGQEFRESLS
jgi:DNA-binding protein HU-beta